MGVLLGLISMGSIRDPENTRVLSSFDADVGWRVGSRGNRRGKLLCVFRKKGFNFGVSQHEVLFHSSSVTTV